MSETVLAHAITAMEAANKVVTAAGNVDEPGTDYDELLEAARQAQLLSDAIVVLVEGES